MAIDIQTSVSFGEQQILLAVQDESGSIFRYAAPIAKQDELRRTCAEVAAKAGLEPYDVEQMVAVRVMADRKKLLRERESAGSFADRLISSAELDEKVIRHNWLIKRVLVENQPAIMGGPKKSLKTSLMVDMAISLGSGTPFVGKFEVPEKVAVAVMSGESGEWTIQDTAQRVALARKIKLADCNVIWGFDLPRLSVEGDLAELGRLLRERQVKVVFIDPAYLCLLSGRPDMQANNMFQIGPLLLDVSKACRNEGATLILVHHTKKENNMVRASFGEPLELEDLAYAGFQEFARQWVLVNRREKFEPGSGVHRLWLQVGGSSGHSGCWGLDVVEGIQGDDFKGRGWKINVMDSTEARKVVKDARQKKREEEQGAKAEEYRRKLVTALNSFPRGDTLPRIAEMAGVDRKVAGPIMAQLVTEGVATLVDVQKPFGRGTRSFPGYCESLRAAILRRQMGNGEPEELVSLIADKGGLVGANGNGRARKRIFKDRNGREDDTDPWDRGEMKTGGEV